MHWTTSSQFAIEIANDRVRPKFECTSSNTFSEKARSKTLLFNSTYSKPVKKKIMTSSKSIYRNCNKGSQTACSNNQNVMKISMFFSQSKRQSSEHKHSNIQLLKKQFEYLEQDELIIEPFPQNEGFYQETQINQGGKLQDITNYCNKSLINQTRKNGSKGFIIAPTMQKPAMFQRLAKRPYLKSKEVKKQVNNIQNDPVERPGKTYNKFELLAPYRKYFPSNRFKKNRSCTLKIDEIMGRRITKLSKKSLQENEI